MPLTLQKLFLPAILMLHTLVSGQQLSPLSPEIGQMYSQGQEYMKMGNLAGAVTTYKEAILLAPTNIILYEALAGAYYGSGDFSAAEQTLLPILGNANADVECYRLAAASEAAQKNTKKARQTIKQGLNIFPASGILYREYGNVYNGEKQAAKALGAWLDGINKDPGYAYNYYEAANVYMASKNIMWGLLYAEMYLNMYHDTTGDETIKCLII
jgi:tetratricopeptide (TPR) repeat protein